MNGYIYTMYAGADPGHEWIMNDPIFGSRPTLGSCVPNIRRTVRIGDWIFTISGRIKGEEQFVVGGFRVDEKIDQLAAYRRFPENRIHRLPNGQMGGNIIVKADGSQRPEDRHTLFERRIQNYIIGGDPMVLETAGEIERGRTETLTVLKRIFGREGSRVFDIVGRGRRMDAEQVRELCSWLKSLKG